MAHFTRSPWSKGLVSMTIVSLSFLLGAMLILCIIYAAYSDTLGNTIYAIIVFIALIAVVVLTSVAMMPRGVSRDEKGIIIHLPLRKVAISSDEIEKIYPFPTKGNTIRLFGIGGIFCYSGIFKNSQIGTFVCYVTDFDRSYVIVRKDKRPIVVTVEDQTVFKGLEDYEHITL